MKQCRSPRLLAAEMKPSACSMTIPVCQRCRLVRRIKISPGLRGRCCQHHPRGAALLGKAKNPGEDGLGGGMFCWWHPKAQRGTQLFNVCCSLLQIPSAKSPGRAVISSVLISRRIKCPYFLLNFLAEYSCCAKNKILVFKGFVSTCRRPGAWKSTCSESHQSYIQPKMPLLSPGMGDTPWDTQKG